MKNKEIYRLARKSLKEHRKSTASTVRGLAVGFIILLPLIVILFGVNVSLSRQMNEFPYLLFMETTMTDYRIEMDNVVERTEHGNNLKSFSGSKNLNYLLEDDDKKNIIVSQNEALPYTAKYSIDNCEYKERIASDDFDNISYYNIIDIDKSDSYFPKNLTEKFSDGIYVNGCDQGFTNEGKKQVVITEKFLNLQNLQAEDVYLKSLSISADSEFTFSDNVTTNISGFICKGYTIVGIIKSEVSSIYSFKNSYSLSNYMKSDFFFTDVNVYNDGVGVLKPHLSDTDSVTERKYLAFDNLDNKDLLNEEYMMLGWNNRYSYNEDNQTIFKTNVYIESNSYKNFYKLYSGLKEYFNSVLGYEAYVLNVPNIFSCYEEMYTQANIISYIFSFVGIIIILCAIINLFSSIKHSVRERKFYLTMLRAIGARDRIIPKLYLVESAIIASRANLFIVGIGFAISAAIKMYIDSVMKNHYIGFDFSIPWFIIIICIVTVVIALYAISLLFAHICTSRLSKKPIVSILNKY